MSRTTGAMLVVFVLMGISILPGAARTDAAERSGKELFGDHCAMCHANGGNFMSPKKTLMPKDMAANGVRSVDDIVRLIRTPGPGMTAFDKQKISDKDAKKIADYILLGTFK